MVRKSLKEEFAKFFENPDRTTFKRLLKEHTGEYSFIDFKETFFDEPKLAKHILGFANSEGGVLIFGIKEKDDGAFEIKGLDKFEDKTKIKSKLSKFIPDEIDYEIIDFDYDKSPEWKYIKNKKFQVILVEDTPQYLPFLSLNTSGDIIHKNRIYYRGKTNTEEVSYEELKKIINRRLDTNVSTSSETEFKEHINQLKILFSFIDKYKTKPITWLAVINSVSFIGSEKNSKYPEEDFENFILNQIKIKKEIISIQIKNK